MELNNRQLTDILRKHSEEIQRQLSNSAIPVNKEECKPCPLSTSDWVNLLSSEIHEIADDIIACYVTVGTIALAILGAWIQLDNNFVPIALIFPVVALNFIRKNHIARTVPRRKLIDDIITHNLSSDCIRTEYSNIERNRPPWQV